MGEWMDSNCAVLAAASWDINGVSIVDLKAVDLADTSKHYQARHIKLGMIMSGLLKETKLTNYIYQISQGNN